MVLHALPVVIFGALRALVLKYPAIALYVFLSSGYEAIRTLPRVRRAKWEPRSFRNGYSGPDVPLLLTEKLACSCFCALQGLVVAPVHLIEDVKWGELRLRDLDPLAYGYTAKEVRAENTYGSYLDIVTDNASTVVAPPPPSPSSSSSHPQPSNATKTD